MRGENKIKGKESRDALRNKLADKKIYLKTIKDKYAILQKLSC